MMFLNLKNLMLETLVTCIMFPRSANLHFYFFLNYLLVTETYVLTVRMLFHVALEAKTKRINIEQTT